MRYLDVPLETKGLGESGEFSGYAAVFGNVDQGGDILERGAFKEIMTTKDNQVRILYQHDMRQPIGKAMVKEDQKGLYFEGKLVLDNANARSAYALMKQGILDGMSIGYDTITSRKGENDTRILEAVKLYEISTVTFGMNPLARIDSVKAANFVTNIKEFEELLRDVGFPRAAAKALAAGGWTRLDGQRDVDSETDIKAFDWSFLKSHSE
jgi:HK97 family phage prohead protease